MALTTGKVRASYVHIFQPRVPDNGGEPKYSVTLLIPKTDTATINGIYGEIERAKQEGAQKVFNGSIPPQCRIPLYDGDGYRPSGEAFGEECRGCMVITASAKQQPVVVGLDMQNILNPADVYSGCYIRANINFFAYNSNGNKGIGCGLNAVQKIDDGDPLGGRISAEEAFGGTNTYAGGYQQPQGSPQSYGGYPQPQGSPQSYGGYPQMQGSPQSYGGYPQPQGSPQSYGGYQRDPITGRPVASGGVMGL
ncbi:MAG: DUF2815 family protein [Lachnospiraceae bacterium]|nr:DUF2815 family protein [Lachnospiraceae bacterium]